jgi:hypothetical protein
MPMYKCGISKIRYKLKYTPVNVGFLWWKKVVFKWQVVKEYMQHYEDVCEIDWNTEYGEYEASSVVAEFDEGDDQSAKDLLSKYEKSMEV